MSQTTKLFDRTIEVKKMTPIMLEILLHYWCNVESDYDLPRLDAPAVKEAIDYFLKWQLLVKNTDKEVKRKYNGNREALNPYIEALCKVPLPTIKWVVEKTVNEKIRCTL